VVNFSPLFTCRVGINSIVLLTEDSLMTDII
jgi:hypothetical protein